MEIKEYIVEIQVGIQSQEYGDYEYDALNSYYFEGIIANDEEQAKRTAIVNCKAIHSHIVNEEHDRVIVEEVIDDNEDQEYQSGSTFNSLV